MNNLDNENNMVIRDLTQDEIDEWEKFYAKDLVVLGSFIKQPAGEKYRLYFKDGSQIVARYSGGSDSDNGLDLDDPYFEDLYELDFIVVKIEKVGTEYGFEEGKWTFLNYHNFFYKFEPYEEDIQVMGEN